MGRTGLIPCRDISRVDLSAGVCGSVGVCRGAVV